MLLPIEGPSERELGFVGYTVPDDLFDALPVEDLAAWERDA